jgi:hypothetical protein
LASKQFDNIITQIDNNQPQINLYAAVDNSAGATGLLDNSIELLKNSLPQSKEQQAKKDTLLASLLDQSDKLQKITKIENFQEIVNASSWNAQAKADNLVFLSGQLYLSDGLNKSIYTFNLKDSSRNQITLADATALSSPSVVNDSTIYYLTGSKIIKVSGQTSSNVDLGLEKLQGENFIQTYSGYLYILNKTDNQIYRYELSGNTYKSKINWLNELADLSQATDFKVNGKVLISQSAGDLLKFGKVSGKNIKIDYKTAALSPAIRADKILTTANNIYLLDLKNSRLINLTKDGALVKQYRLVKDGLKDFAIDEAGKSAYILAGTTVYKFGL